MTSQSGGGGVQATQTVGGVLAGNLLSPTFAAPGVSVELGYVQATVSFTGENTSTFSDVTGMSLTVTVGIRPIVLKFFAPWCDFSAAAGEHLIQLFDVTGSAAVQIAQIAVVAGLGQCINVEQRLAPAAGVRTYKVQAKYGSGDAGARIVGGVTQPMWFQVREV